MTNASRTGFSERRPSASREIALFTGIPPSFHGDASEPGFDAAAGTGQKMHSRFVSNQYPMRERWPSASSEMMVNAKKQLALATSTRAK